MDRDIFTHGEVDGKHQLLQLKKIVLILNILTCFKLELVAAKYS
jgi:hypothetical protein